MQTKWTLMGFVFLMFAATAVLAQTTGTLSSDRMAGSSMQQPSGVELCRGSSVIGAKVVNTQGEDLGKIHEIVLNSQRDQIGYAVLAHGGIAGVGEKLIAIPWSEFKVQTMATAQSSETGAYRAGQSQDSMTQREGLSGSGRGVQPRTGMGTSEQQYSQSQQHQSQRLVWNRDQRIELTLPVSKDQISRVQGFKSDAWPEQASANWQQQTTAAETTQMSSAQKTAFDTRKLSKVIGMKVESSTPITFRETSGDAGIGSELRREGRAAAERAITPEKRTSGRTDIGKIKDCVLNSDNGRLIYCVVSLSEISGHTREMSVVPWEAIRVDQQQQIAQLQITSGDNLLAFTFQSNQQPDLADRNYLERVYTAFNVEPQWEALGFVPPSGESRQPGMRHQQQQQQQQRQPQSGQY